MSKRNIKTLIILFVTVLTVISCQQKIISRWDNGALHYVNYSKHKHSVREEEYRMDGTLKQIIFMNKTGYNDSVRKFDSTGVHATTLYYNNEGIIDSIAWYFRSGKCRGIENIFRFDTVPCNWDTGLTVEECEMTVATGHEIDYYANGRKQAEGDYSKGKKDGVWNYFDSLGNMKNVDTL